MDAYKYLPPKFSRCVKDLIQVLDLKADQSHISGLKISGDVNTLSVGRTSQQKSVVQSVSSASSLNNSLSRQLRSHLKSQSSHKKRIDSSQISPSHRSDINPQKSRQNLISTSALIREQDEYLEEAQDSKSYFAVGVRTQKLNLKSNTSMKKKAPVIVEKSDDDYSLNDTRLNTTINNNNIVININKNYTLQKQKHQRNATNLTTISKASTISRNEGIPAISSRSGNNIQSKRFRSNQRNPLRDINDEPHNNTTDLTMGLNNGHSYNRSKERINILSSNRHSINDSTLQKIKEKYSRLSSVGNEKIENITMDINRQAKNKSQMENRFTDTSLLYDQTNLVKEVYKNEAVFLQTKDFQNLKFTNAYNNGGKPYKHDHHQQTYLPINQENTIMNELPHLKKQSNIDLLDQTTTRSNNKSNYIQSSNGGALPNNVIANYKKLDLLLKNFKKGSQQKSNKFYTKTYEGKPTKMGSVDLDQGATFHTINNMRVKQE